MAVAYETSLAPISVTWNAAGETETHAFNAGTGSDRVLLVCVTYRDDATVAVSGVTYNGVAMTSAGTAVDPAVGNGVGMHLFYLANPASGSNNIAVTMSASGGSNTPGQISAWVGNGGDVGGTPVDGYVSANGSGSSANIVSSSGAITSATGDMIVTFNATQNGAENLTATATNFTERQDAFDGGGYALEFGDAAGAATVTPSATWSNSAIAVNWAAVGINVNASGGGGGGGATVPRVMNQLQQQGIS